MAPPPVCLDTTVTIMGIKGTGGDEAAIERSKALIQSLRKSKVSIVLPTVVMSETLVRVPFADHRAFMDQLQKSFIVVPFDTAAASQFANLWNIHKNHVFARDAKKDPERTRAMLKADCMIIATAMAVGAECIYTHNTQDFNTFHVPGLKIRSIPDLAAEARLKQQQLL
jgi:hypothetical protein